MLNDFEKAVVNVVERMSLICVFCPHCDSTAVGKMGHRSWFYVRQRDAVMTIFCPFCGQVMAKDVT